MLAPLCCGQRAGQRQTRCAKHGGWCGRQRCVAWRALDGLLCPAWWALPVVLLLCALVLWVLSVKRHGAVS